MNIDYTALGAWTAIVAIVITIWALIAESRRSRFSLSVDLILKLDERFNSELIHEVRRSAAKALSEKTYSGADDVLDYFEMVGMLLDRGALDEQMIWVTFSYWIENYWSAAKDYIMKTRENTPAVWFHLSNLRERMVAIERRESGNKDREPRPSEPSEEELKVFLEYEMNL